MILHPIVVVFTTVIFVMVVFDLPIAEIFMVLLHMVLHTLIQLQSLSFPHQLLFKKVVILYIISEQRMADTIKMAGYPQLLISC